jgi:hypothetical protein
VQEAALLQEPLPQEPLLRWLRLRVELRLRAGLRLRLLIVSETSFERLHIPLRPFEPARNE